MFTLTQALLVVAAAVAAMFIATRLAPQAYKWYVSFAFKLAFITAAFVLIFQPQWFGFEQSLFGDADPVEVWNILVETTSANLTTFLLCIAAATGVKLLGIFSGIIRWRLLLRGQGLHIPLWYMAYLWFMGRFVGLFLPGTLGLDGYRLIESWRYTGEGVKCTTVVAVEKLIGFIALTFLVFLTFPLGYQYFDINTPLLAAILLVLGTFVAVFFTLLLNPRVIQVGAAILPLPGFIKRTVNHLGLAVTAYSGHKFTLLAAVFFGLMVHVGTALMYFFTFLGIRATGVTLADTLFVSPLLIYGSVLTPTVSGLGVREFTFSFILGDKAGGSTAVLGGHLGLWSGELIPFMLSLPLLLFGTRPSKATIEADLAKLREETAKIDEEVDLHLTPEQVGGYRKKIFGTLACGLFGGAFAGIFIGLFESGWLSYRLAGLSEMGMFTWAVPVYGLTFAAAGIGVAAGLCFLFLLADRFPTWRGALAWCWAGTFALGALAIGLFRYRRDVLDGMNPTASQAAMVAGIILAFTLVSMLALYFKARYASRFTGNRPIPLFGLGIVSAGLLWGFAALLGWALTPAPKGGDWTPPAQAEGPNIIFIGVDALRADYLKRWDPSAEAETPHLDAFLDDAIMYERGFSQASWTKASFGSIFTSMYPECHTAVTKDASLPPDVDTVAELLQAGGYYTQGYSNNPNISSVVGYDQGFVEYVDLKPSLYFGATVSASKLFMYEILRRVQQTLDRTVLQRPVVVTEFYQPAEVLTDTATEWIASRPSPDTPFYLFMHYMDPHDPFMDPDSPQGGYARVRMGDPDPDIWLEPMRNAYIGEIEHWDAHLGRFLQWVKDNGYYEDALIILTADHGEEFYDHGGWWHGRTLYQEQTHIPYAIKLPSNERAGDVNTHRVRHIDLAPTMLHFAGLEPGPLMQGQVLFDEQLGDTNKTIDYVYAENNLEGIVLQSVRTDSYNMITANEDNPRGLSPIELYNISRDPKEQENLADQPDAATVQEELLGVIDTFLQICEEGAVEPVKLESIDPAMQEQLEGLGYL